MVVIRQPAVVFNYETEIKKVYNIVRCDSIDCIRIICI